MKTKKFRLLLVFFLTIFFSKVSFSEEIKNIEIIGNDRITKETIMVFGGIKQGMSIDANGTNQIIKKLYDTTFFTNIEVNFNNGNLIINLKETPFINLVIFKGIDAKKFKTEILKRITLKEKTSFTKSEVIEDVNRIKKFYRDKGYFFANVEAEVQELSKNRVNLIYSVEEGSKATIKKIFFTGDKQVRDIRLLSVITSEEDKLWKFISSSRFLNAERIALDKRLLKSFYLNKGYYEVDVSATNVEYAEGEGFILTYNINAGKRYRFKKIFLDIDERIDSEPFFELEKNFEDIIGHYYSPRKLRKILKRIDNLSEKKELQFINHKINETLEDGNVVVKISIFEGEKLFVERINVVGNSVTRETVIRSKMEIDEGDAFSELLLNKSVNNIQATRIFAKVKKRVLEGSKKDFKIIEIEVEEQATGELAAGAGVGTEGGTFQFSVRENNFLGSGVKLDTSLEISEETLRGKFSVDNPNYNFSGNSLTTVVESTKTDKLSDSGYESTRTGFSLGTRFEQYEDIFISPNLSLYYEDIETNSSASNSLKKMEGNYTDFIGSYAIYSDKRDQKFRPTDGYLSVFRQNLPLYSDVPSILNGYDYTTYESITDDVIGSFRLYSRAINAISDEDVKISQRLHLPSRRLRGFQRHKVGPVDGNDHVGGNYAAAMSLNASLPNLLPDDLRTDINFFIDAGNVWDVDYDSSLGESNKIRSAFGLSANIFTPVGPLNFTLAQDISKADTDKTESFRFNLGTTF